MNKFPKTFLLTVICGAVLLTGCDREEQESSTPSEIVISGGDISTPERTPFPITCCGVRLEKAVERAVSLSPAATEIIFELGFGDTLVGVSSYCDYPAGLSLEKVGSTENPDLDKILALNPDAVFTLSALSEREAYTLSQAGIAVLTATVPSNMEGYSTLYTDISAAFYGREYTESQKDITMAMQIGRNARSALEKAAKTVEPYTFLYVTEKLTVAGTDCFESAVLSLGGGNMCTQSGYVSPEELECAAPAFIIADNSLSEYDIFDNQYLNGYLSDGAELRFVDSRCFERPTARTAEVFASLKGAPDTSGTTEETGETDETGDTWDEPGYTENTPGYVEE